MHVLPDEPPCRTVVPIPLPSLWRVELEFNLREEKHIHWRQRYNKGNRSKGAVHREEEKPDEVARG